MSNNDRCVYIVTEGNYSDYRIMNVFDSEEAAEAFVAWQKGPEGTGDDPRVETWEMHDGVIPTTGSYEMSATVGRPDAVLDDLPYWDPDGDPDREPVVSPQENGTLFVQAWGRSSDEARERRDEVMEKVASREAPHA